MLLRQSLIASLIAILLLLFVLLGYLSFSSPGQVAIDNRGKIDGGFNQVRAHLQGTTFWSEQLDEANRALELLRSAPERKAVLQAKADEVLERSKKQMADHYGKYPNSQPSKAAEQAEALRARADEIEQAEIDEFIEEHRLRRMSELENIILVIESRVKSFR